MCEALVRGDADADTQLLSDDFLGVHPSGFADRTDHAGQLAHGPTVAHSALSETRFRVLSDGAVVVSYRADWERLAYDRVPTPETMFVTSLWCRRGRRWENVFSQDTPAERTSAT